MTQQAKPGAIGLVPVHGWGGFGFGLTLGSQDSVPGVLLRLAGCNARELLQPGGTDARDHLALILSPGTVVTLHTVKPDKFGGRWDATVEMPDGTDLATRLCADQWAAPWSGLGPRPVPPWPREVKP